MSKAKQLSCEYIYATMFDVASAKRGAWHSYFTVGEVAKASGYSRPTVRRVANELVAMGVCHVYGDGGRCKKLYSIMSLREDRMR